MYICCIYMWIYICRYIYVYIYFMYLFIYYFIRVSKNHRATLGTSALILGTKKENCLQENQRKTRRKILIIGIWPEDLI